MGLMIRDYDPNDVQDAERVAAMFNDFDSAWPGGFMRGARETGDRIRERKQRLRRLAILVAECDDELVGYCDLEAQPGQHEIAYVSLLGARASHHGKGVGKMLLREIIRRATALGYPQVTLHTWAGNTKAVPLYKKVGFHWVPETTVYMRNFIPTILTMPEGKTFFAERDWYECHQREIVVAPDDVTWKGMKVYPYRFRDGDDFLNAYFGAEGERLTGIETPDYAIACTIPVEEAPAGDTVPITWKIAPAAGKTLEVALLTETEPGLEVHVQERFTVSQPLALTRELRISRSASPRREGEPAYRVRTTLLVDGRPIVLETGVKVVHAIEIDYAGQGIFPGRAERVEVRLKSNLDRAVSGRLALDPHPALRIEPSIQEFTLEPRLMTQCAFTVTAQEPGVFPVALRYFSSTGEDSRPIAFRAFGGSEALVSIDAEYDQMACLESPALRVEVEMREGKLRLHHPIRDEHLIDQGLAELGPPFVDGRLNPPVYAVRAENSPSGVRLVLTAPSEAFPGLAVERRVSLLASDVVRVDYRVINATEQAQPCQLRLGTWSGQQGWLTMPTEEGVVREPLRGWGEYPQGETDMLASGASLAESWIALEDNSLCSGLLWHPGPKQDVRWSRIPYLTWDPGEIPPQSSVEIPPLYLIGGAGDWRTVRGWWRRLIQPSGIHEAEKPQQLRVLEVRCEPAPALLNDDHETTQLQLLSRRGKSVAGTLTLTGERFQAEPATFRFENVDRDHPFTTSIQIAAPASPQAGFLQADVETGPVTETRRVPLVRLGTPGTVRVTEAENGVVVVDNGLLTLRVAPGFLGSLYALEREGVNHLLSAYPQPKPFVWANPWYGGVHPFIEWMGNPRLTRETFTGGPAERVGERGIHWQGVLVKCAPQQKEIRWLRLEVEYLTVPGSNLVALAARWTNVSTARMQAPGDPGIAAWTQVGGTREHSIVHWERHGEARQRRRSEFSAESTSDKRVSVENAQTGDILTLVASGSRSYTYFEDFGEEGMHLMALTPLVFEPGETKETLSWLVLCRERDQLDAYGAALSQITRLP